MPHIVYRCLHALTRLHVGPCKHSSVRNEHSIAEDRQSDAPTHSRKTFVFHGWPGKGSTYNWYNVLTSLSSDDHIPQDKTKKLFSIAMAKLFYMWVKFFPAFFKRQVSVKNRIIFFEAVFMWEGEWMWGWKREMRKWTVCIIWKV